MPPSPKSTREVAGSRSEQRSVRIWRKVFVGLYLTFTGIALLWTFLTLLAYNCGGRAIPGKGPQIRASASNQQELHSCLKDLERLLTELHKETFTLQAKALRFNMDPSTEWRNWSEGWRLRWSGLAWRCRLGEIGGQGVSPAIDSMAEIHAALDELHLSYAGVVDKFIKRYLERLRRLRSEIAAVNKQIGRPARGRSDK